MTQQDKNSAVQTALSGRLLAEQGVEYAKGRWDDCVYLGKDGFVYHLHTSKTRGGLQTRIAGKRAVGEYLRWVDGIFRPGELPGESNAVHFRAAKLLRELI